MKFSAIVSRVLFSFAVLTASVAGATPLTWTLQGVVFDDGATAAGTLVVESTTGDLVSWNITTTPGTLAGFTYDAGSSFLFGRDVNVVNDYFIVGNGATDPAFGLAFASALTAPGTVNFALDASYECSNCFDVRFVTAGSISTATQVPEPAPLALFGIALAALAVRRKLRT